MNQRLLMGYYVVVFLKVNPLRIVSMLSMNQCLLYTMMNTPRRSRNTRTKTLPQLGQKTYFSELIPAERDAVSRNVLVLNLGLDIKRTFRWL